MPTEAMAEPAFSLEEVAKHRSRQSCWIALHDSVYDFTSFVDEHPGGARGLLRHAGTDASEVFAELHSQSIFAAFGPKCALPSPPSVIFAHSATHTDDAYVLLSVRAPRTTTHPLAADRIGRLLNPSTSGSVGWRGVPASDNRSREGILAAGGLEAVSPTTAVLPSPFPHDTFSGSGLETFRFHWAVSDRLLRKGADGGSESSVPLAPGASTQHVHRQKSNLGVLDHDRDWLHVGEARVYAAEMTLKRKLLLEHTGSVYVTDPMALAAEKETLAMALEYLERKYPDRFEFQRVKHGAPPHRVTTLTPGYLHSFLLSDWERAPLQLLGMLIQEDCYLLAEMDVEEDPFNSPLPVRAARRCSALPPCLRDVY